MTYSKLKVEQLRTLLDERGITPPKNAKKADLIALLEEKDNASETNAKELPSNDTTHVVEAEVIDNSTEDNTGDLAINFTAGSIAANFDALDAKVESILSNYEGWQPSADNADDVSQCSRERKYLNGLAKQIDERRKAVKNQYLVPLNDFEMRANSIRDKIKHVSARLSAVEKQADEARKDIKREELREHYEAFAGMLLDVVPYEKVHQEKWLNKSYSIFKAKEEIEESLRAISNDWETLKELKLEFYPDAEARFFDSLNLSDAIAFAKKLAEDKRAINALKQEMEQVSENTDKPIHKPVEATRDEALQPTPKPDTYPPDEVYDELDSCAEIDPQSVQAQLLQPAPRPVSRAQDNTSEKHEVLSSITALLERYDLARLNNLRVALSARDAPQAEKKPYIMVVDGATQTQLDVIGKFCGFVGVTGCFKHGSVTEVFRRENPVLAAIIDTHPTQQKGAYYDR